MKCPECGYENNADATFCCHCAARLEKEAVNPGMRENISASSTQQNKSMKFSTPVNHTGGKKCWGRIMIPVLVVLCLLILFSLLLRSKNKKAEYENDYDLSSSEAAEADNADNNSNYADIDKQQEKSQTQTNDLMGNNISTKYYVLSTMTDSQGTTSYTWNQQTLTIHAPGQTTYIEYDKDGTILYREVNGFESYETSDMNTEYEGEEGNFCKRTYNNAGDVILTEYITCGVDPDSEIPIPDGHVEEYKAVGDGVDKTVNYYYNDKDKLIQSVLTDHLTGTVSTTDYIYDSNDNIIEEKWTAADSSGTTSGHRIYTYTVATKEQYDIYMTSECLKDFNIRINVYTNHVFRDF